MSQMGLSTPKAENLPRQRRITWPNWIKENERSSSFEYGEHWADVRGEGATAIITWGSTAAVVREAGSRLQAAGT